ncbi:hypothetical protein GQ53DRAFT_96508 [Thozetella sp. PMI_491]|nr:hypothetical protein GQ53DRAFT_96508 [Thozetella sp. PMI_491]
MAPPAKRRKRNVVDDDESEAEETGTPSKKNTLTRYLVPSPASTSNAANPRATTASPSPLRKKSTRSTASTDAIPAPSLLTRSRPGKASTKSPSTSPDKSRTKKLKLEDKGKTADLLTLFSKQAQKSQSQAQSNGGKEAIGDIDLEDFNDPISDDEVVLTKAGSTSIVGKAAQNAQKRFKSGSQPAPSSSTTSARFIKTQKPPAAGHAYDDSRPWSERFAPANLDELAVHKKKVADVRKWLEDAVSGRTRQRLLILKGAAGTGKTTTLQLLAREMQLEVLEWRNPTSTFGATLGFQSASAQFDEFLGRGGKFGQLDLDEDESLGVEANLTDDSGRRVILIEEFPNTFMRSSSALRSFRNTILQFLATNTPSLAAFSQMAGADPVIPVVMVISETLLTTTSASADSFTAHRLLGPEILRHPGSAVFEFNPIAPSLLAKALELVVQKEARKSGRRRTPGPLVLKRLGEIGDIRSAISSLEFLCVKGDDDTDWGAKVAFTKPKRGAKDVPALTKGEQESLELISQREASLGIFHAVGKAVYNKREEQSYPSGSAGAMAEALPDYIAHRSRPKPSQVAVDSLIDETGTDIGTFISALHENYLLSCEAGPQDMNSSVDYVNECLEYLSEADLLAPSWDIFFGGKGYPGGHLGKDSGSHVLRQDEMAFHVAVRGLLFSLPHPVRRQTHPTGGRGGGDAFKMFFPTSIKLWRTKEELETLIDMWATKMLKGEDGLAPHAGGSKTSNVTNGSAAFLRGKSNSGNASDLATSQKNSHQTLGQPRQKDPEEPVAAPLLSLGTAARGEMLLERLPYMTHIARRKRCSFGTLRVRDLDRMVSFQGIGPPKTDDASDDEQDENGGVAGEGWATDKPTDEASPRKKSVVAMLRKQSLQSEASVSASLPVESLVLSDDDIEDD